LSTSEAKALIDEIAAMQIFYINIGGGEPMIRRDFFELIEHAVNQHVGVKFSTNGTRIDEAAARRLASIDYLDIQISIDGVDAATSDRIRGAGSYDSARRAMDNLKAADFGQFKISVVMTRESIEQLDEFESSSPRTTARNCASRVFGPRAEGSTCGRNCTRRSNRTDVSTNGCSRARTC
jgi:MoaA/NifB/PqqE/SkfB family radical SAM enzyme